jgi:glycosidase
LGEEQYDGLNLVFLFDMLDDFEFEAGFFKQKLKSYEQFYPEPYAPVYVFSNHDQFRSITRLDDDPEKAKLLAFFQLTVRGATFTYQGEEIGMTTGNIPVEEGQDPLAQGWKEFPEWLRKRVPVLLNRDNCRTPMQWSSADNAGFSDPGVRTWLPIQPNYGEINVASAEKNPGSLLHVYRELLTIKKEHHVMRHGSLEIVEENIPSDILAYVRKSGDEEVLALLNFLDKPQSVMVEDGRFTTRFFSINPGDDITGREVRLSPFGGILIK